MADAVSTIATPVEPGPKLPDVQLIETDGMPLESDWHRDAINLLIEQIRYHLRDRRDFFAGGNMFIYFNLKQARNRDFRGPDFFFVNNVPDHMRDYWVVWEEGGRYPDVIIELLSPSTAETDRTIKKAVYERTFRTPDYFCYDPETLRLEGWRLAGQDYQPLTPNEHGRLWCAELGLWLGTWEGPYKTVHRTWLRFFDPQGQVVPLFDEAEKQRADAEQQRAETEKQRAEAEKQRAEAEKQRADAAEAELARLKALLAEQQKENPPSSM